MYVEIKIEISAFRILDGKNSAKVLFVHYAHNSSKANSLSIFIKKKYFGSTSYSDRDVRML